MRVQIPYSPRRQFMPFHERKQRWSCIVAHRRAGKTVACLNELQKRALLCERERPRFAYVAPFLKQAKSVAWDYMLHYSAPIPGINVNHSELRIDYPNGGQVRLWGADNADAMRGLYFDGIILDEPADMHPRVWPEIFRPALSDRQGWAVWIGTPKGKNEFWSIYDYAKNHGDEWLCMTLKASLTGLISADELADARKSMSQDEYDQEFECSFDAAIKGAYYGTLMREAEEEGRIKPLKYEPRLPVHTAWDLGIGDSTAIWFVQQHMGEVRVIDYYESFGVGLDHYAKVLQDRKYVYGEHILPHDAAVADLSTGKARVQTLASLGINGRVLDREGNIDDGIAAVRSLLPNCWFDAEKCAHGIECLKQYRCEYDEERKIYSNRPRHDWTSHAADAFRYLARGLPDQSFAPKKRARYTREPGSGSWMSA